MSPHTTHGSPAHHTPLTAALLTTHYSRQSSSPHTTHGSPAHHTLLTAALLITHYSRQPCSSHTTHGSPAHHTLLTAALLITIVITILSVVAFLALFDALVWTSKLVVGAGSFITGFPTRYPLLGPPGGGGDGGVAPLIAAVPAVEVAVAHFAGLDAQAGVPALVVLAEALAVRWRGLG